MINIPHKEIKRPMRYVKNNHVIEIMVDNDKNIIQNLVAKKWVEKKAYKRIDTEFDVAQEGKYDGCEVYRFMIKSTSEYKAQIDYKSDIYPSEDKALDNALIYVLENMQL